MMNWHGALPFGTEGYEYHTLAVGMALAVMISGAGSLSLDRLISQRFAGRSRAVDTFAAPEPTYAIQRERGSV